MTTFTPAEDWRPPQQAALFGQLTEDGQRIILVFQGASWQGKQTGERLKHITPLISKAQGGAVTVPATWAAVTQVAFSFTGQDDTARWVPLPRLQAWILDEFTRRTAAASPLKAEFPPWLKLRDYQVEGAAKIAAVRRFLLCDEPGVGKTCTTIAGLAEIQARGGDIFPMVVVVPSWDVADGWVREIGTWTPGWHAELYGGTGRAELLKGFTPDVYITTYATARIDAADMNGPLVKLRAVTAVADEFHFLKTNDAKQSRAFRRIARRAANVVELSGTPVTKDTGDTYPAADALDERSFPDRNRFVRRYCQTSLGEYGESIEGLNPLAEPEFRAVLLGQMRRVAKADVLTQLPPKIYSVRRVKIPPQWRKAYDQMEASMLADLPDGGELPAFATITQMMFLSRIASTAGDVSVTEEEDPVTGEVKKHYHYDMKAPSWKADVLMEILTERRGQPVAAFAPFKPLMMIAGQQAEAAGLRVGYITGIGDGVTRATRQKARTDFRDGKLDLIACTTGAGGVGIDGLQIAGTMVMLQRPWPLGDSIQSEDRLHRIGSEIHTHGVEIIDIVAEDTVDSRIRERLTEKAGQLGELVKDPRIVRELLGGLKP